MSRWKNENKIEDTPEFVNLHEDGIKEVMDTSTPFQNPEFIPALKKIFLSPERIESFWLDNKKALQDICNARGINYNVCSLKTKEAIIKLLNK
jgi:hypothetical protein